MVEKGADEREDHVESTVVSWFGHAACALSAIENVKGVGAVERREAYVEASGDRLLLYCGEDGVGVLKNGNVNGKKKTLELEGAGGGEKKF